VSSFPPEPSWDNQFRPQASADLPTDNPGPNQSPVWFVLLLFGAVLLAGVGFLTLRPGDDSGETATEVAGVVEEAPVTTAAVTSAAASEAPATTPSTTVAPTTSPTTTSSTTTTSTTSTTEAPRSDTTPESVTVRVPSSQALIDGISNPDTRTAVFSGGKVYLRGEVPNEDIADVIFSRAAAVLGPDNVVVEYEINPEAPVPNSAPLYVDDKVLFEVGSAEINSGFTPLLDLGTTLMQQTETVRIAVIAHTDSIGSAEFNQLLSERRAEAVKAYWQAAGIDESRIDAIGLGESLPQADNLVSAGRAANRRAEFIVQGILG